MDDHDDTREMIEKFLRAQGFPVSTAADGVAALASARRQAPSLILLDVTMPIMDGEAFALRLRESADMRLAATPIVLVTALANPEDAVRRTGARAAVPKPVCLDRMMFEVARHCLIDDDETQCAALHSRVNAWAKWTERREQRGRDVDSGAPDAGERGLRLERR